MSSSHKQKDYSEWVWGKQAVLDLIKIHPQNVERVLISAPDQDRQRQEIADLCARAGIPVSIKEGKEISRILPVPAHQNAAARFQKFLWVQYPHRSSWLWIMSRIPRI
jgi:tRNA G18 (ribose-2'-O)-methylase SpoU